MNKEEAKQKIIITIEQAENLIPKKLEANLSPINDFPEVPAWDNYETQIWQLGEKIRHLFKEHNSLRKDKEILDKIISISLNRKAKRGRQSFILLLGNINCKIYADKLVSQLDDNFVAGQIIDSIYKMKVPVYLEKIKPICNDKTTWVRNKAKQYIKKYGC